MTDPDTCGCGRDITDDYADGGREHVELCIVCAARELAREVEPDRVRDREQATLDA